MADFLGSVKEKEDFNQYWYSGATIAALVSELPPGRVAFLSTPSLFFAVPAETRRAAGYVLFDFDPELGATEDASSFCLYDFNAPTAVPPSLHGAFSCVVIDPPFITEEVWAKYAETAKLLLAGEPGSPNGCVIGTTIAENAGLLSTLLNAVKVPFQPSIPHLVYQYETYIAGFTPAGVLSKPNPEIPSYD